MGLAQFLKSKLFGNSPQSAVKSYNGHMPFYAPSSFINSGTATWRNFSELIFLLNCYYENPVVNAVVNIKSEAFANMQFKIKILKTKEIISLDEYEDDKGQLHNLLRQPNPLQSTYEWLRQHKVNREVFGNGYIYASVPVGWEGKFNYQDISVINNLPPYCIAPVLTGNWMDATTKDEIISSYEFSYFNGKKRALHPNTVLHLNNVNISFDKDFTTGKSDLLSLKMPITNIDKAYESRNVLITKRGPVGILTSDMKNDVVGSLPLDDDQVGQVQKAFDKYGLMHDQYTHIISPLPLTYTKMGSDLKDLMLFEEIESNAIAVCNSLGVPEDLVRYYIRKGGLSNETSVGERRLYDSTIIPESKDFIIGLNNFLNTKDLGIEIIGSFDHLNVLQENKKDMAQTNKFNGEVSERAFRSGAIVYNDYLDSIGLQDDPVFGEFRIWDLSPEQQKAIGVNPTNTVNDESSS